ncbi:hypothetical protein K7W03_22410 [Sphingobium sp. PNB]|uniref:hypothetical protein n=1 Tax=Sphingobium sp. PNB TaxID=863934 RepID=UPI001CA3A8E6|nr:hypothetical protein [Sphingobium sp. PNB]MCB4862348.1 hypothetical protein [Sphingobium sp. PNB]
MRFRFIGTYTGDETITLCGVAFLGREPSEVTAKEAIRRLSNHPEFETVDPLDHDADGHKGGSVPRRGRRKV